MKQTAVEFMVEQLNKSIGLTKFVDTCDEEYKQEILGIIEQAKVMERDRIVVAIRDTEIELRGYYNDGDAEFYYNETFKTE